MECHLVRWDGWDSVHLMAEFCLRRLDEENAGAWDDFNLGSPDGSVFHSIRWQKVVEWASENPCSNYLIYRNDEVIGLFPLVDHEIRVFHGLVPCWDPQHLHAVLGRRGDRDTMQAVIEGFRGLNRGRKRPSYVCLSTVHEADLVALEGYPLYPFAEIGDMLVHLSRTPPDVIWDSFSARSGQRKFIRRFEKDGFEVTEVRSLEEKKLFYQNYRENMTHVGGTVHPFARFMEIWDRFYGEVRSTLLSKGEIVAGGLLTFLDRPRKTVYLTYLAINRNLPNRCHPSYALWWDAVNWAWESGYETASLGVQHHHDFNRRFRMKRDFSAHFRPIYSKMVPLTSSFAVALKTKEVIARRFGPCSTP